MMLPIVLLLASAHVADHEARHAVLASALGIAFTATQAAPCSGAVNGAAWAGDGCVLGIATEIGPHEVSRAFDLAVVYVGPSPPGSQDEEQAIRMLRWVGFRADQIPAQLEAARRQAKALLHHHRTALARVRAHLRRAGTLSEAEVHALMTGGSR